MDSYDEAIEYLTKNPTQILLAWKQPDHEAHCLFLAATRSGKPERLPNGRMGMGLTAIRACWGIAATEEITTMVREDRRLPDDPAKITLEHLPLFAEYQRLLDKEVRV
jgi:hypothetical protein